MANPNWTKGVSGNPKGRPRIQHDIVKMCKSWGPEVALRLYDLAMGNVEGVDHSTQVRACCAILDRGYGKPNQTMDITSNGETLQNVFVIPSEVIEDQKLTIDEWAAKHKPRNPSNLN